MFSLATIQDFRYNEDRKYEVRCVMPEICRFYGIVIKMIFNDNDKHHKPHVHVYYGEYEASMSLDGEVLEGKIPVKQYRMVSGWMALHEEELYAAWNNAVRNKAFEKIEPLK